MKMNEVRRLAKAHGIKTNRKAKDDLIREIQRAEGNFDCFGSAGDYCDQLECRFRDMCLKQV
jgi:hypothetical protein